MDKTIDENFLLKILEGREKRAKIQKKLNEKYKKTLISFTLNIPGEIKNSHEIQTFFKKSLNLIKNEIKNLKLDILYEKEENEEIGNSAYLVVDTENSLEVKRELIKFEENLNFGRILDIDVFDTKNTLLSRKNLNIASRKCILCENEAIFCIKNKSHSYEELNKKAVSYIIGG